MRKTRKALLGVLLTSLIVFAGVITAYAAIGFGSYQTGKTGTGGATSISISRPSGVRDGDVLIAQIVLDDGSLPGINTPSGWVRIDRQDNDWDLSQIVYYRVVTIASSEPSSYTWSFTYNGSNIVRAVGGILCYSGVDTSNPIIGHSNNEDFDKNLKAKSVSAESGSVAVALYAYEEDDSTLTKPSDMTERYQNTIGDDGIWFGGMRILAADKTISGSATGDKICRANDDDNYVAQMITLRSLPSYTVTYSAGSHGSLVGGSSETVQSGLTPASVPGINPTNGYTFTGWYMNSGTTLLTSAQVDTTPITAATTFTAQYIQNTTTTVTSSVNPSTYGQTVTFSANISPSAATGTVQFKIDNVNVGSPITLSGGTATMSLPNLAVGNHTVTAAYNGNTSYLGSTGTLAGGQQVNQIVTTTTVMSSDNPSYFGEPITFTAAVSPSAAAGTVQFKIDNVNIGSPITLSGGTATMSLSNLTTANHTVVAVYSGNANYAGSTGTLAGGQVVNRITTITTVSSSNNPSTYGESVTFTATVSPGSATGQIQFVIDGAEIGSPVTLSGATATMSLSNLSAANHTVMALYSGSPNHVESTGTLAGGQTVNKVTTTTAVTSSKNPSTYGESVTFTATISPSAATGTVQFYLDNVAFGSPVSLSGGTANSTAISNMPAGSRAVRAEYSGSSTHDASVGTTDQTVNKADAVINVQGTTVAYDGNPHGATGTAMGVGETDLSALLDLGETFTDVPGGTAHWSFAGGNNYNSQSGTVGIVINKADATIKANDKSKTYGDAEPSYDATVTGAVNGETLDYTVARANTSENVGTYDITVTLGSGAVNDNYNIALEKGTLTIGKADATIKAKDKSKTYGDAEPVYDATVTGARFSDVLDYSVGRSNTSGNAGTYDITVTLGAGAVNNNYNIALEKGTLTIGRKAASIAIDSKGKIYGAADPVLTAVNAGMVGSDSFSYTLQRAAGENVNTYAITATLGANPNYDIAVTDGVFTISKKAVTVVADNKSKIYGDADPALTAVVTGNVNGEAIEYTLARAAGQNVGNYAIGVTLPSVSAVNANYDITVTSGSLTIGPRAASIAVDDKSKRSGNADPALTAIVTGTVNDEVLVYTLSRETGEAVGTYAITANIDFTNAVNKNYDITVYDGTLRILARTTPTTTPTPTATITPTPTAVPTATPSTVIIPEPSVPASGSPSSSSMLLPIILGGAALLTLLLLIFLLAKRRKNEDEA